MSIRVHKQAADVLFGAGAVSCIGSVVRELGLNSVVIITDPGIAALGHPQRAARAIEEAGVACRLWDRAEADVPVGTVREAVSCIRALGADGVVGIGGGSSLDTAKAAAALAPNDMDRVLADIPAYLSGQKGYEHPPLPCVMIPTTAGTGSEVTCVGVISDPVTDRKIGLPVKPAYAIVDPALTLGSPARLTAWSGLDAWAHAFESLASTDAGPHSRMCALEAIRLLTAWLPAACESPERLEPRERLSFAANLAGVAFSEACVHIGHSAAHALGHAFQIPHGLGCALVTPGVIAYTARHFPGMVRKAGLAMGLDCAAVPDAEIGGAVARAHAGLMRRLNLPTLSEFTAARGGEITLEDILGLAGQALADPIAPFYDGPYGLDTLTALLRDAFYWRDYLSDPPE